MDNRFYKLIASDFDGTLLKSDGSISDETLSTIKRFTDTGGIFSISTGRTLQSILPIARRLGLQGIVSCFNGSVVAEIESGKVLFEKNFSLEESVNICQCLEELGLHINAYEIDEFYSNKRNDLLEIYEKICGVKAVVVEEKLSSYIAKNKLKIVKFLTLIDERERNQILLRIKEKLGNKCYVTSGGKFIVELCSKGFDKGSAVEFITNHYQIPLEDTIAVGDALNDLPALQRVGLGIAVANAELELKEKVFVFDKTNDENAIKHIIEKFTKVNS